MANNFNLGVEDNNIEELLEEIPKEMTNEELLKLDQDLVAKEEVREKETVGEAKEEPQENSQCRF